MSSVPIALGRDPLPAVGLAALTLGVFDGVHRGHRALAEATVAAASAGGWRSVALVFDPHPDEVLRPGTVVPRLAPAEWNRSRMERDLGIDDALVLRFDDELRSLPAEEFLDALRPQIDLRAIVMSPESAFGRGRGGTVARLRELGASAGFSVVAVPSVELEGAPISSMRIRTALAEGNLDAARRMGYEPMLLGRIEPSGRMAFGYLPALPASGTYLAEVRKPASGTTALIALRVERATDGQGMVSVDAPPRELVGQELELGLREAAGRA